MKMAEGLQRDRSHRALRYLGEQELAQLGECRGRQTQRAVRHEQRDRQDDELVLRRQRQRVDDLLEDQRHADVGDLGGDEA